MSTSDSTKTVMIVAGTAIATVAVQKIAEYFFPKSKGDSIEDALSSIGTGSGPKTEGAQKLEDFIEQRIMKQNARSAALLSSGPTKQFPKVMQPDFKDKHKVLVTGGAGFVGSHVVDMMMKQGHMVYVMDNLFTGHRRNIEHWIGHPNFTFFQHDVVNPFFVEVDRIYHMACPASPPHYQYNPIKTVKVSTHGTLNMLGLAKRCKARLLFTSTSEIYGDPEQHPQKETYWGNVNTLGIRSCYDEGKRVAETMCFCYQQEKFVDCRIARIFNTYGPRMDPYDGRVVSNFIIQSLKGKALTVYGKGDQTRSFQYVEDLVRGLVALMESDCTDPVNIGNPTENTILEFANTVNGAIGNNNAIIHEPLPQNDPTRRKPDISRAYERIGWKPVVSLAEGLARTIDYFKEVEGISRPEDHGRLTPLWLPFPLGIPSKDDKMEDSTRPSDCRQSYEPKPEAVEAATKAGASAKVGYAPAEGGAAAGGGGGGK